MGRVGRSIDLPVYVAVLAITIVASYHSITVVDAGHGLNESNGLRDGSEFYCYRGFKRCMSGIDQCIKPKQECDGVNDCVDGSDEGSRCAIFNCRATGRYLCPSGRNCMNVSNSNGETRYGYSGTYSNYLCDGVKDCADGSDEDEVFCKYCATTQRLITNGYDSYPSSTPRVQCPSGKGCVSEAQLCDGVVHCVADGGSDESDSFCKIHGCSPRPGSGDQNNFYTSFYSSRSLFQCRSGRCIDRDQMCDGKIDCPEGDDEGSWCATTRCPNGRLRCPSSNQTCVGMSQICDGSPDCGEGEDEKGCEDYSCPSSNKCPSGKMCMTTSSNGGYSTSFAIRSGGYNCDAVRDCKDGSDEDPDFCRTYNCSDSPRSYFGFGSFERVKCDDGHQCVASTNLCDGKPDCLDGSDENPSFCRNHNCTDYGKVKCPGRIKTCISPRSFCDGISDCLDSSDEDPAFCASEQARNMLGSVGRISCRTGGDSSSSSITSSSSSSMADLPPVRSCNNVTVYIYGRYCDGEKDCADGSDEERSFCADYTCPEGYVKCHRASQATCVTGSRCDGNMDCADRSDETGCPSGSWAQPSQPQPSGYNSTTVFTGESYWPLGGSNTSEFTNGSDSSPGSNRIP